MTPTSIRGAAACAAALWTVGCSSSPVDSPNIVVADTLPSAAVEWLAREAVPFGGVSLELPHDDLEVLRGWIGDARVVALGENTHGTRDFFQMKARILRFLVEEMGFDAFAIEATWPEANRLDHYVRTGEGDPAQLLAGLYFWTWNTAAVLEMIEWMREHNAAGGDVGFYGFDMQYPGMAIHNVRSFVEMVDADAIADFVDRLECLEVYANGPDGRFPNQTFAETTAAYRSDCLADLTWVEETLSDREGPYVTASTRDEFELALRSARVASQYAESQNGGASRDEAMAANAEWLAERLGPDGRIVLWAHNFHVSDQPGAMGGFLRPVYGGDMVIVGFTHASGTFTAVSPTSGLGPPLTLDAARSTSYEQYFSAAGLPRFLLDLRAPRAPSDSTNWLEGPRWTRFIGCCWEAGRADQYWSAERFPDIYDVVIHIDRTQPTILLNSTPPPVF